jgi:hypothetical protein
LAAWPDDQAGRFSFPRQPQNAASLVMGMRS